MTLNFRRLGSYCPALLSFAVLLLSGVLALDLVPQSSDFSGHQPVAASFVPSKSPAYSNLQAALNQLPLSFEPNQGQSNASVRFLARGAGYGLFLTSDQAFLALDSSSGAKESSIVSMQLAGANPAASVSGVDPLPGKSNYFIGNDPSKWHRDIPQFARVRYHSVYPGIDLVYYGNQGHLEYDFEVAAGADPAEIALGFEGAKKPEVDGHGDLIVAVGAGDVRLKAPRIYQSSAKGRESVAGRFTMRRDGKVGFEVGAYDRSRTLVIDPVLVYSTYFGGSDIEACSAIAGIVVAGVTSPPAGCPAIAIDASANIYLAGSTRSANLQVTPQTATTPPPAAFQDMLATAPDAFVTKLNPTGSAIIFSTYLGGNGADFTAGIAADSAFNVAVAGTTTSTDFPTSAGSAFQATAASVGAHAFVTELDATGHTLVYSTYLSGNGTESARGLALDFRNKIYVIGTTTSTLQPTATSSFPATVGALQVSSLGTSQFFVSKIDPVLIGFPSLVYSTYFGGGSPANGMTVGGGIAVDANANVYITGGTNFLHTGSATTDFPILNAYQGCLDTPPPLTPPTTTPNCSTSVTATDAFVAKINPAAASGSQLLYSSYLGGTGNDVGYGIAVDSGLSAYVTGSTSSGDFTLPSGTAAFQPVNGGGLLDAFLGKFGNPCTGASCTTTTVPLTYFSYLGGTGTDVALGIAVDTLQGARIAGWTTSANFPTPNNPLQSNLKGAVDPFVARIDTTAASAIALGHYGTYLGGSGLDFATSIAADPQGNSYVAGETASGDFPLANPIQPSINGGSDIFVSKLGPVIDLAVTETVAPNPVGVGNNVTFTYTITNSGDLTTGIIFTDVVSSGATFVSASSSPGQSSCPANGGSVTCTVGSLNGGAVATVDVVLTPTQAGSLSDGGSVTVFGTNKVFVPALPPAVASVNDFTLSVSPQTVTVPAGTPAAYTVTVTPTGNIPETVTLSASGAPTGATTTFPNGASFSNLSSGPQSRQLVVNTTARVTTPASLFPRGNGPFYAALFPVSGLALVGAGIGGKKSLRRRWLMTALLGIFFALIVFQAGCSSSSTTTTTTGTPAGTYNLTLTATSGTATRTQQIVLVVQ